MKKILTLFLTLAMLLSLAACGNKEDNTPVEDDKTQEENIQEDNTQTETAEQVDLAAFYTAVCEKYGENFPATVNLTEMPESMDGFFPGLSAIEAKQLMIYQPMMGAVVCEIALVEVTNSADVDAVKAILQGRIDTQVEGGAWCPESIEGWKSNSRIVTNGNCLMMIAYSECDAVVGAFNGLF